MFARDVCLLHVAILRPWVSKTVIGGAPAVRVRPDRRRDRGQFENRADQLTRLLCRTQALAHATMEILYSIAGAAPHAG